MSNYLEGWSRVIKEMAEEEQAKEAARMAPILALVEELRADATGRRFSVMLEALILYASEGENADDWVNTKWQAIATQLRAAKTMVEYTI